MKNNRSVQANNNIIDSIINTGSISNSVIQICSESEACFGLHVIDKDYFKKNNGNFEEWKSGYPFNIFAIKEKLEFRREKVLSDVRKLLESNHKIMLIGERGTSKSTVLMEIVCDYLDMGYWALYNDRDDLTNSDMAVKFIKGLLKSGKKIIVAVDDVHKAGKAAIFSIIEEMEWYTNTENLRFILTAEQPEYTKFSRIVPEAHGLSFEKLNDEILCPNFKKEMPLFNKEDIKNFIRLYWGTKRNFIPFSDKTLDELSEGELDQFSEILLNDYTKGNATMVKFFVVMGGRGGLDKDVKERYRKYLQGSPEKIKTMFIVSLLRFADFDVTNDFLEKLSLLSPFAKSLNHAMLYRQSGHWDTIESSWSREFMDFMFNQSDEEIFDENKTLLWEAFDSILLLDNEDGKVEFLHSLVLYGNWIPLKEVESKVRSRIESSTYHLTSKTMACLLSIIGNAWRHPMDGKSDLNRAFVCLNEATEIDPDYEYSWLDKGDILWDLGKRNEALECYDKAIKINPNNAYFWAHKGDCLRTLGKTEEALRTYSEGIKKNPTYHNLWGARGSLLWNSGRVDEAIANYKEALETNPTWSHTWYYKASLEAQQNYIDDALKDLRKAIELDERFAKYALEDKDFEAIKNDERFKAIVNSEKTPTANHSSKK
jgi:Tfp pilus assembly protein PilF